MTLNIITKIEMILHATEDYQKISESFHDMFAIEKDEISVQNLSGHFGNTILMLSIEMKKKHAEEFLKHVCRF